MANQVIAALFAALTAAITFAADAPKESALATCVPPTAKTPGQNATFEGWELNCYPKSSPFLVRAGSPRMKLALKSDASQSATVLQVRKVGNLELIDYYAGSLGTTALKETYRTVVFNIQGKKFVGEFPAPAPRSKDKWEPKQEIGDKSIVITEPLDDSGSVKVTTIDVASGEKRVQELFGKPTTKKRIAR